MASICRYWCQGHLGQANRLKTTVAFTFASIHNFSTPSPHITFPFLPLRLSAPLSQLFLPLPLQEVNKFCACLKTDLHNFPAWSSHWRCLVCALRHWIACPQGPHEGFTSTGTLRPQFVCVWKVLRGDSLCALQALRT